MELRIARHTERLDELVAFYRDGIGLMEIGGFRGHDGYDGVFLAIPGTHAHLELTTGGDHGAPTPHPETLLVLYLGDKDAVDAVMRRLASRPSSRRTRIGRCTARPSRIPMGSVSSLSRNGGPGHDRAARPLARAPTRD
jgi:hypothetical protein